MKSQAYKNQTKMSEIIETSKEFKKASVLFSQASQTSSEAEKKEMLETAKSLIYNEVLKEEENINNLNSVLEDASGEMRAHIVENISISKERLKKYRLLQNDISITRVLP